MEPLGKNFISSLNLLRPYRAYLHLGYVLNKRTPKPAGCEDLDAACQSCPVATCGHNTSEKGE